MRWQEIVSLCHTHERTAWGLARLGKKEDEHNWHFRAWIFQFWERLGELIYGVHLAIKLKRDVARKLCTPLLCFSGSCLCTLCAGGHFVPAPFLTKKCYRSSFLLVSPYFRVRLKSVLLELRFFSLNFTLSLIMSKFLGNINGVCPSTSMHLAHITTRSQFMEILFAVAQFNKWYTL